MKDDTKEVLRLRVARVQRSYHRNSLVFRVVWVAAGLTVFVVGLAMTVLPGPALVLIPVGMAMLAAEFRWARRLLDVGIDRGVDVKRRVQASRAARLLTTLSVLFLAGAVVTAVLLLR